MTSYTVILDLGFTDPESFDLDPFAALSGVLASGIADHTELILTVEAGQMRQAINAALVEYRDVTGNEPHAARALPTAAFDQGADLADVTQTITVDKAAQLMGLSGAAIRYQLKHKKLPGDVVGRDWRVSSRLANLYDGRTHVARIRVPAGGVPIVYQGERYLSTGGGHSIQGDPIALTYVKVNTGDVAPSAPSQRFAPHEAARLAEMAAAKRKKTS